MVVQYCCCQSLQLTNVPAAVRTGAYSDFTANALHFTANQAVLSRVKYFTASLYGEKPFLLSALSFYHIAVTKPVSSGAFGMQIAYAGNVDYNSLKTGIAYGRLLSERISVGVQFNYWNQQIRGYGNAAAVSIEGGLLFHFSEAFQAGIQLCNPVGITLQKQGQQLPSVYTIGANYQPSQNISITTELSKTGKQAVAVQAGAAYKFAPKLWAQTGINSRMAAFYVGAGYQLKEFSLTVIGSVHPQLGLSPALMLTYNAMDN